jgi:hypothetical protein
MIRIMLVVLAATVLAVGCAQNPATPSPPQSSNNLVQYQKALDPGPHRLWAQYRFLIDESHTKVDVVPERYSRLHLNVPKFLEEYCSDCLKITGLHNNGDSTIDLTVEITHPFAGHPEYTGFDVKGILMFQGSHEIPDVPKELPLYPQSYRLSWRLMGDPELLNAEGYTYFWSPWYDSGSDKPVFNYYQGKYASGTPTANINGFLYFYSNETRHMFEEGKSASRTYHIWLPTGPVEAGYAVDACWEPPDVTPVTNPATDFPVSANQPEPYHFKVVANDGLPVTDGDGCCMDIPSVYEARAEIDLWYVLPPGYETARLVGAWNEVLEWAKLGCATENTCAPPEHPDWYCLHAEFGFGPEYSGTNQILGHEHHADLFVAPYWKYLYPAFDVFEVVVDK